MKYIYRQFQALALTGILIFSSVLSVSADTTIQDISELEEIDSSHQDEILDKKVIILDPGHGKAGSGTYRDWNDFIIDEAVINCKITTYTKEYLENNYADILVYTTKVSQDENPSLSERVQYGADKGADVFVSQHINATGDETTSANGVLAMVPKLDKDHSYHKESAQASRDMASLILEELTDLGFNNMHFQERLSEANPPSTYEDGSVADYYGIVKGCRKANLPGVIIEHGFANNRDDALKLKSDAMLKKIGEADAIGIARYLELSTGTSTSPSDNTGALNHIHEDSNTDTDKEKLTGWQKIDNKWYYYDDSGKPVTGWQKINGKWYYMDDNGVMQTGWLKDKGIWYYLSDSGAMLTGWVKVKGIWYYMDTSSGAMTTGWQKLKGIWYYMDTSSGAMLTGWLKIKGTWYYMDSSGAMLTGWLKINGTWYYMDSSGAMLTGWLKQKNTWYYMDSSGAMVTGWKTINNKTYYFNDSGAMLTGTQNIDNKIYEFADSGELLTGV